MPYLYLTRNPERDSIRVLKGLGAGVNIGTTATMLGISQRNASDLLRFHREQGQLAELSQAGLIINAFRRNQLGKSDVPRPGEVFTLRTKAERDLLATEPSAHQGERLPQGVIAAKNADEIGAITLERPQLFAIFGLMAGWNAAAMADQTFYNKRTFERNTAKVIEAFGVANSLQLAAHIECNFGPHNAFQLPVPPLLTPMSEFNTTVDEVTLHIDRPAYVKHPSLEAVDLTLLPIEPK